MSLDIMRVNIPTIHTDLTYVMYKLKLIPACILYRTVVIKWNFKIIGSNTSMIHTSYLLNIIKILPNSFSTSNVAYWFPYRQ